MSLELPTYEAKPSEDFPKFLLVFCPRSDCPSYDKWPFLVHRATWTRPLKRVNRRTETTFRITGRSCPYCFRPSHVPKPGAIR